ncbi:Copper Transporter integral membrane protein that functions in high affinity copper transport [Fusarium falciforme]|uniref:Copper transport protein n=1 Tax=Fusarium falciforme TaxID=195108 RepID=A0A9W8V5N3_9HYPO|nr:Copper transport protein [Fusarium sp. Ph1]KAJ4146488.1 Copper Transporter integral membrane protein that functions in high affinity copper transport [Fusarium falciforme]KAJ4195880.1 Copper Transporter integral membrane protein that functions in high affinity copper transport [Fusarium falciforme]KAJ4199281.1 Copper Transporter integral membrane protein that functions in high affinity copper transport [Fusarium falciforme]KAJ4260174.1 Copper Transporter integral membrane protein that functi
MSSSMDHNMHMTGMSATATATMSMDHATMSMEMPASTSAAMDMDHGMGNGCKISMLWNWNTVDSCFIAETWHITSKGMFAGSCIGVILLVMTLELLRRSVKEWDRFLLRQHAAKFEGSAPAAAAATGSDSPKVASPVACATPLPPFRPNVWQQAIRALLHMMQFAVAYFVMLLAMYYNGYFIICIFIGAYLGAFIFQWETLSGGQNTSASREATVCCG